MVHCPKCAAPLQTAAKFCSACGAPARASEPVPGGPVGSIPPGSAAPSKIPSKATEVMQVVPSDFMEKEVPVAVVDPLASTLKPNSVQSPLASTAPGGDVPAGSKGATQVLGAFPGLPSFTKVPEQALPAADPPAGEPPFSVGTRVLVMWADGNRYPGAVTQTSGLYSLIVFQDGQTRWVEAQYLSPLP